MSGTPLASYCVPGASCSVWVDARRLGSRAYSFGAEPPADRYAGWAVVVSLVSASDLLLPGQFVGCFSGSLDLLESAIGASFSAADAYMAEVAALFWGGAVALRLACASPWLFRADNISALSGVAGSAALRPHPLCEAAIAVHTTLRLLRRRVTYQHVLGHSADPANELADALAGRSSRRPSPGAPLSFSLEGWFSCQGAAFAWLPHVVTTHCRPSTVPALHAGCLSWSRGFDASSFDPARCLRPFLRAMPAPEPASKGTAVSVDFGLATFNALSLLDRDASTHAAGLHGATGRVRMLCASLDAAQVCLAGLQECRTFRGSTRCSHFTRLASGRDEHACFGVELWIRDHSCFDALKAVVLHAEPTFMIVSLPFFGNPLKILVAHCPHRAHSEDTRRQWWSRVTSACDAQARSAPWILLLDGNCRLGSVTAPGVGSWQADAEDLSGEFFRKLLSRLHCWLPATFCSTAVGSGGTLCQKRNAELVRSDYVALPLSWTFSYCSARVDPTVSSGHGGIDHFAALVHASVRVGGTKRPRSQGCRIDPVAVAAPENRAAVEAILDSAPVHEWSADASIQAADLAEHLYSRLQKAFPLHRRRLRGGHFSDHTARLHTSVSLLRRSLRTRTVALDATRQRCAFAAWKQRKPFDNLFSGRWLWQLQTRRALDCLLLHRAGPALRRSCRADRGVHLAELSEKVAIAPCSELHQAVRRIMRPKKFRKKHADPLPMLVKPGGGFCQSHSEILQVWRDHFRSLEAGLDTDPAALVLACRGRQAGFEGVDCLPADQLPTWPQLQTAFRTASPHKAHGPDLLPPVLCTLFSQKLTELFWPVLLKTVLRSNEPIGLKGGVLHRISKPTAVANSTAGYRGILVQSCLSKALHRAARHLAVDHWSRHQLPLQLGGRKGCSAQLGHFCSRAFLAFAKATSQSAAILFVDIAAAYYGVIREALLGPHPEGRPVEALAASLGLTREDLQRLHSYIHDEPILREQSAADLFCEIAGELHRNTWFVLAGDTQVVETHRGTRPGGSLADVLFNILFCRVLQRRDEVGSRSATPLIPWHGCRAPFASSPGDSTRAVVASDVVYADDLASFLVTACASALPRAISSAAADTVDVLLPHGLNANIGPTKTAAVAVPVGRGCRAVRRSLFSEGQGRLAVLPENRGAFRLDLVPSYKHLGSIVSHSGCMLAEIRHRLSAGRTALQEGKQRLFACKSIPLKRRAVLFRSHVLSAVLAGVGAWPSLNGQEWNTFSGGLVSLTRQLLCLRTRFCLH